MNCFHPRETFDMRKIWTLGLALGFGLMGAAADAGTPGDHASCESCGAGTVRRYRTIHPVLNVTRYHDKSVYHYVERLHYLVDVTRIQPIVHVQDITRVHHYAILRDAYVEQPQPVMPDPDGRPMPGYAPGCGCVD